MLKATFSFLFFILPPSLPLTFYGRSRELLFSSLRLKRQSYTRYFLFLFPFVLLHCGYTVDVFLFHILYYTCFRYLSIGIWE